MDEDTKFMFEEQKKTNELLRKLRDALKSFNESQKLLAEKLGRICSDPSFKNTLDSMHTWGLIQQKKRDTAVGQNFKIRNSIEDF